MPTLYLDCDGFFAACEESADPALHGQLVGVATIDPDNRAAVLIAVNTAAKRRGLGKGESAEEARRLVPDLTVRHQRPELYVATHHAIARALDTVLSGARPHSVDELAAELAPNDEPEAILEQVKAAIAETLGPVIVNLQGKVIRVLHLNLTRVREPDYGLWLGWFPVFGLLFLSVSNCF